MCVICNINNLAFRLKYHVQNSAFYIKMRKIYIYTLVLPRISVNRIFGRIYSSEYSSEPKIFIFFFFQNIRLCLCEYEYIRIRSNIFFQNLKYSYSFEYFFFKMKNIRIRSNINGDIRECSRIWVIIKNHWDEYSNWHFNYIRTNIIRTILRILVAIIWSIINLAYWFSSV